MKKFKEFYQGIAEPKTAKNWVDRALHDRGAFGTINIPPRQDAVKFFDEIWEHLKTDRQFHGARRVEKHSSEELIADIATLEDYQIHVWLRKHSDSIIISVF